MDGVCHLLNYPVNYEGEMNNLVMIDVWMTYAIVGRLLSIIGYSVVKEVSPYEPFVQFCYVLIQHRRSADC